MKTGASGAASLGWVMYCQCVRFWSRVCGEACLVGTADKTRCGGFQMTATVTESAMRWAKWIHILFKSKTKV